MTNGKHECESHAEDGIPEIEAEEHDLHNGWICHECKKMLHHTPGEPWDDCDETPHHTP